MTDNDIQYPHTIKGFILYGNVVDVVCEKENEEIILSCQYPGAAMELLGFGYTFEDAIKDLIKATHAFINFPDCSD